MHTKDPWVTRESLLLKVKNKGDEEAWQEFSDYYLSFVQMVLDKLKIDADISNDISQEVLLRIWSAFQSENGIQRDGKFRNWLSTVITKKAKSVSKRLKRFEAESIDPKEAKNIQDQDDVESYIDEEWKLFLTNKAIEETKKRFRGKAYEVFQLDLDGKSAEEICKQLDLSIHAVYTYRARFKKQLVKQIRALQSQYESL
jgi:RNA polymerase sigma-70 factor (ECF subfamily)